MCHIKKYYYNLIQDKMHLILLDANLINPNSTTILWIKEKASLDMLKKYIKI